MPVITREERVALVENSLTKPEKVAILKRINDFQVSITDKSHIEDVDSYIQRADLIAMEASSTEVGIDPEEYNRVFHRTMNRFTREARLRI